MIQIIRSLFCLLAVLLVLPTCHGQTNQRFSNPVANNILQGNYNPDDYKQSVPIMSPEMIFQGLVDNVNSDSLKSYLEVLSSFENRNTGSDTLSDVRGIGAARRWCLKKFGDFSLLSENRLVPSFFVFDQNICGMERHKNIVAMLPGVGDSKDEVIVVEAHLDSRCETGCDIDCHAEGMEDNGSGSALVLELARIMSQFSFDKTIVFMLTIGEEQGLHGARAFATYCKALNIPVIAAYNNDIVGGVICGKTASPPGCPGLNMIDSTNVRVYSQGGTHSKNKMLARFLEIQYKKHLAPKMSFANVINIMSPEDRGGRGGDHIPFRENGYPTVRFSSANEHGDGNPSQTGYCDRQHTMEDVLGVDTDADGVLDSFFVDFNYLGRNAIINGGSIAVTAFGPKPVTDFSVREVSGGGIEVTIDDPMDFDKYIIGVRRLAKNTFDTIVETTRKVDTIFVKDNFIYYVNVATVDEHDVQSRFCFERDIRIFTTGTIEIPNSEIFELLQNYPNPFDDATTFAVIVNRQISYKKAEIRVINKAGQELSRLPISLNEGSNEVLYSYDGHAYKPGVYLYGLWVDDIHVATKTMVYAY